MRKIFHTAVLSMTMSLAALSAQASIIITEKDQTKLALTVYNQDFAFFQDYRNLPNIDAKQRVYIEDTSPNMLPETLRIENVGRILEQANFQSHFNYQALLNAYLGKEIEVARLNTVTGKEDIFTIELINVEAQHVLVRRNERIELIPLNTREWRFIFPSELPDNLQSRQGVYFISNGKSNDDTAILSYLSSGIGWNMDYVLTLNAEGNSLDIEGLATISNYTGINLRDASVRLVAGDVNMPHTKQPMVMRAMAMSDNMVYETESSPESLQNFYLYRLPNLLSMEINETKQIPLIQLANIEANIKYSHQFSIWPRLDQHSHQAQANISLVFDAPTIAEQNSPLPAGQARVFRPDTLGEMLFVGAANLSNLAAGETTELSLGRAFDLNVQRRQTYFKEDKDSVTIEQEVVISNAGAEEHSIEIGINFQQDWTLLDTSHPIREDGAGQLTAKMVIPAESSERLSFKVEVIKRTTQR